MRTDRSTGLAGLGGRLAPAIPYLLLCAAAVWLWTIAGRIEYPARHGALGPDVWPRVAIAMIGLLSLFQIVKLVVFGSTGDASGIGDKIADAGEDDETPRSLVLLLSGIALTAAYALSLETLGFPLATAIFLIAFMYLGGSRRHVAVWLSSVIGVVVVSLLLMRVVYVALPRGVAPFDRIADLITGF